MMISKELLSEVLEIKVKIRGCSDKFIPNNFEYIEELCNIKVINIHELAHKCKEWLHKKDANYSIWICVNHRIYLEKYHLDIEADTEPQAIFKACQWILDNENK